MSVFSKIRGFFSRHRNKFFISGIVITGSILLSKYAQQRLKEWQEKETMEFLERNRKLNHFESIGRTCNQTILNLSAPLIDVVVKAVDTDEIIEALKSNPENKLELWNNLKYLVFVKASCMVYSLVMLVITLKIQLNIVGGYLYKDPNSVTTAMQEKYLSVCQNFLNDGLDNLVKLMENEIRKIVENVDLIKQLKLSDVEAIFWSIQTAIATHDDNPIDNLPKYIMNEDIPSTYDVYSNMLRDTADLLDSDEVKTLATHCINRGFILLGDQIAEFYDHSEIKISEITDSSIGYNFQNPFDSKKPMAKLIPIINGLLSKQSLPQAFVQQLLVNEKLQVLGANVYESLL